MRPDQNEIYYGIHGERHGPVSAADIRELVRSGSLSLDDYLWDDERDDWVAVGDYPQLRDLAGTSPPAPPADAPFPPAYRGDAWDGPDPGRAVPRGPRSYAGFGVRLVAHIIDSFALFIPLMIWMFIAAWLSPLDLEALEGMDPMAGWGGPIPGQEDESAAFSMLFYLGSFVLEWLYRALLESSPMQATLGKRAMDLRVTDQSGRRIGFLRASVRHWSKILSTLIFYFGFVMIAFTDRHQGLHDKVADTFVQKR